MLFYLILIIMFLLYMYKYVLCMYKYASEIYVLTDMRDPTMASGQEM
jgi:hypothetical protein